MFKTNKNNFTDLFDGAKTFDEMIAMIKTNLAKFAINGIMPDGDEILCNSEEKAEAIADFAESIMCDYVSIGYYDPIDDMRNNEVDFRTGLWYICVD